MFFRPILLVRRVDNRKRTILGKVKNEEGYRPPKSKWICEKEGQLPTKSRQQEPRVFTWFSGFASRPRSKKTTTKPHNVIRVGSRACVSQTRWRGGDLATCSTAEAFCTPFSKKPCRSFCCSAKYSAQSRFGVHLAGGNGHRRNGIAHHRRP